MAASRSDISAWFDRGVDGGSRYMVIVCDTWDHDDYPCFFDTIEEATEKVRNPGEMQRVMESYDLDRDKEMQLGMTRCHVI